MQQNQFVNENVNKKIAETEYLFGILATLENKYI